MPFKDLGSFNISEDCVRRWAEDLSPNTAKNYVYYFLGYLDWTKTKKYWRTAKAMLDEYDKLSEKYEKDKKWGVRFRGCYEGVINVLGEIKDLEEK